MRQRLAAVDDGDVVETEKSPFEDVQALAVDLVDPPGEVHEQLLEALLEERRVSGAGAVLLVRIDPPARPGVNRRIQIRELPFVSRDLAVRMLELLEQQQPQIVLRELRVDQRERDGMERQVPRGEPRILPFVGHRKDPHRVQVAPVSIADVARVSRRRRERIVAIEPNVHVEEVELLAPQHAGERLALHELLVGARLRRMDGGVEFVGFRRRWSDDLLPHRLSGSVNGRRRQAQGQDDRTPPLEPWRRSADAAFVPMPAGLTACSRLTIVTMECIFGVRTALIRCPARRALGVGFVIGEERRRRRRSIQLPRAEPIVEHQIASGLVARSSATADCHPGLFEPRRISRLRPRRSVPTPTCCETTGAAEVQVGAVGSAIEGFDANADVFRRPPWRIR